MPMISSDLADEIKEAIGQSKEKTSDKTKSMAKDIVDHFKMSVVNNPPGTVTGTCADGVDIADGAATSGIIVLSEADLIARFVATFGISTPEIIGMATAINNHVKTGTIEFSGGSITGPCAGGSFTGSGSGGQLVGLNGNSMATLMATLMGKPNASDELKKMCQAIVDHIQNNAEASYAFGTVTGTYPSPAGGPLAAGTGVGGSIQ